MADSIGMLRFFLSLCVAAALAWIMQRVLGASGFESSTRDASQGTAASQGTEWLVFLIEYWPVTALFISFLGLVAYSVFVRRGVVR